MMEAILRRDALDESMNDMNLDEWKNLVVLCAANRYDGIKLADQHVAQQLAQLTPVLYVDPTVSFAKVLSTRQNPWSQSRLRILGPGLARLTPVVQPFPSRKGMTWLIRTLQNAADACYTIVIFPDLSKIAAVGSDGLRIVSTLVAGWAPPQRPIKLAVSFLVHSC